MKDINNIDNDINTIFNKGITLQRELYKQAMIENDYSLAITCIENIKTEIKNRAKSKGMNNKIEYIESIISWYRNLPFKYQKKTPEGYVMNLPYNIENRVINAFNLAYESIIIILNNLKLL